MSRRITNEERDYVFNLLEERGVTVETLSELFLGSDETNGDPRFDVDDFFVLPENKLYNKRSGDTTIGIYVYNYFIVAPHFGELLGYINKPIDGKTFEHIEAELSNLLYTDKIDYPPFLDYLKRIQWLGGNPASNLLTPSFTYHMLSSPPQLDELLQELTEKYKDLIVTDPALAGAAIEKELIAMAEKYLNADHDTAESFASRAKISIENNYKKMNLIVGPLQHSATGDYKVIFSNYNKGISKEDYAYTSDSSVMGAYARSTAVAVGGYMAKRSHTTLNTITTDEHGSDCGTTEHLQVFLYPELNKEYLYRYMLVEGGKYILLTPENISTYYNTWIWLRSPMFCHTKDYKYCNKCVGEQPYMLGLTKFGLAIARLSNTLLNLQLKKFHDLTVKVYNLDKDKVLNWIE